MRVWTRASCRRPRGCRRRAFDRNFGQGFKMNSQRLRARSQAVQREPVCPFAPGSPASHARGSSSTPNCSAFVKDRACRCLHRAHYTELFEAQPRGRILQCSRHLLQRALACWEAWGARAGSDKRKRWRAPPGRSRCCCTPPRCGCRCATTGSLLRSRVGRAPSHPRSV